MTLHSATPGPVHRNLRRSFYDFAALANHLDDVLVLVRQQTQSKSNVVPLPLTLGPRKSRGELACQLLRMLVLHHNVSFVVSSSTPVLLTFSINPAKNLIILLKLSSSSASSAESRLNISTKLLYTALSFPASSPKNIRLNALGHRAELAFDLDLSG